MFKKVPKKSLKSAKRGKDRESPQRKAAPVGKSDRREVKGRSVKTTGAGKKKSVKRVVGKGIKAGRKPLKPHAAGAVKKLHVSKIHASRKLSHSKEGLLRRQLLQQRETIIKEAKEEIRKYVTGEARQLVETALDDGDWSVIDLSEDINLRRLATHREFLQTLDETLRKLGEGSYGICEGCGDRISAERLKVMPFTIFCRDCQEKKEELEKVEREEIQS